MPDFQHRDCTLVYDDHPGPTERAPVLLLHGLGSSARDWEYQLPALLGHYRLLVPDLRGHGRSGKPRGGYSMAGFAEDCAALLDRLGCGPVHLVGISMGGMIGFQLACDRPDLLRSLTIVNSAPEVIPRKPREHLEVAKRKLLSRLLSLRTIGRALGRLLFPKAEQAGLREKIEARWAENDKRAYLASLDAIIGWGVQERLAEIACPTLVISADRDYTPVSLKQAYCERIADARLVVVEDSRHATPMDQPEIFNTTLLGFLADIDKTKEQPCSNVS
ncbi:alpha/beta hydrolase [Pseudomonas aeruginosa]|nr:alpha/beta hydrolase [Pseudomonas aeruginosa]